MSDKKISQLTAVTDVQAGDEYVVVRSGANYKITGASLSTAFGGGGSQAGAVIVRKFPFAFNTPGILTGAPLYVPTVGDILLDGWVQIDTAWDGTSPLGDVLSGVGDEEGRGMFGCLASALNMSAVDVSTGGWGFPGSLGGNQVSALRQIDIQTLTQDLNILVGGPPATGISFDHSPGILSNGQRVVPSKFTSSDPVRVVVSQNGTITGASPGSTQGAGVLYLSTATPA